MNTKYNQQVVFIYTMYITMYCVAIIKEEVMSFEKKQGNLGGTARGEGEGRVEII